MGVTSNKCLEPTRSKRRAAQTYRWAQEFMKTTLITLLLMISAFPLSAQDNSRSAGKEAMLARALSAMQYAPSFKQGFAAEKKRSGKTTPFIERVLEADNSIIETAFARVYATQLSEGRNALDPNPPLRLTQEQVLEARAFTNSDAGSSFKRISEDEALMQQVGAALQKILLAH
jgi:hypothetical protein